MTRFGHFGVGAVATLHGKEAVISESVAFEMARHQKLNDRNDRWVDLSLSTNIEVTGAAPDSHGGYHLTKAAAARRAHLHIRIPVALVDLWFDIRAWAWWRK